MRPPRQKSLFNLPIALLFLISFQFSLAEITVYTTYGTGTGTSSTANPAATALCISATACDGNVLTAPANPTVGNGLTQTANVQLVVNAIPGLGGQVNGHFQGFSIELSVAPQLMGNDGNITNPIFMNLMSTVADRAGKVLIRVGGNSQETMTVVPGGLPNNTAVLKTDKQNFTPTLFVSPNLLYVMSNISSLINADWFIGLPFNDTENPRTLFAELGQKILGSHLVGMQLGNEPDLYYKNNIRNSSYDPIDYFDDWGTVLKDYQNDPNVPNTNNFVAPSVCCGPNPGWTPEQVWNTGFLTAYAQNLAYISVQSYPSNNCNSTSHIDPNSILPNYLSHSAVQSQTSPYINSSQIAGGLGKPMIMFETNTASCGGFSGLSDSFASALWAIDYNLNMAVNNFSNALYHVGGQSDYYNPFTPPPTNQTKFRQWSIGPTMYSAIVTAEALGNTGKAQVADLGLNSANDHSPGYVIAEGGVPQRLLLMNYLTDPSGASNYTAYISIGGNNTGAQATTPASVTVKYLLAPSVIEKWNITWAGQTFGGPYGSDGRLNGTVQTYTVQCDTVNNFCPVTVPAPGVAIVFLSSQALDESTPTSTETFSTSTFATTATRNTASVNPTVLATSNGRGGQNFLGYGSTSPQSNSNQSSASTIRVSLAVVLLSFIAGLVFARK